VSPAAGDDAEGAALRETLAVLGMPPAGVRAWIAQGQGFCRAHGGRARYAELMDLYDECLALLAGEAG
jgi:hypothetical protein